MLHFMANTVIDSVQSGKKQFISTFVTDEKIATILENFVDAQTAYTKSAVNSAIETSTKLASLVVSNDYFKG